MDNQKSQFNNFCTSSNYHYTIYTLLNRFEISMGGSIMPCKQEILEFNITSECDDLKRKLSKISKIIHIMLLH